MSKIVMKYMKGESLLETSFERETVNDCARGVLNALYGYPVDDIAMDDAMIEFISNPAYYSFPGEMGDLRAFILVIVERFENLKFISLDDEVLVDR